jgi:sugar phosphate isomerase/epimerase
MANLEIGLNTEAFRHADKPLEYSLEAIRKQGYRYCELNMLNGRDLLCEAGYYGAVSMERDPLEVRDLVKSFGLKVSAVSAHAPMAQPEIGVPFLTRAIEFAHGVGDRADRGVSGRGVTDRHTQKYRHQNQTREHNARASVPVLRTLGNSLKPQTPT